jgi:hypothetical protein
LACGPEGWESLPCSVVSYVEYFVDNSIIMTRPLHDRELKPVAGEIVMTQEPGLGFLFDKSTLTRNGTTEWIRVR